MASSPQKNLQFISPPKEAGDFLQNQVKNERLDKSVYEALRNRTGLIDHHYRTVQYLLFSKSGFSDWILTNQKEEAIMPIDLMQMYTSH